MNNPSTWIIAGLVSICLLCGVLVKCERDARVEVEKELAIAQEVNKANDEALKKLNKIQETTDAAIASFINNKEDIEKLRKSLTASIQRLLTTNEDFRKWYSATLPSDVIRVYNETARTAPDNGK